MAAKIFISYRREDGAFAGRIHDCLLSEFGGDLLFMDVDAIPLGVDFLKILCEAVSKCDVLLAVIGPNWIEIADEEGRRKLDNPDDPVRIEVGLALKRDIPVVPILLGGAKIPKASRLPDDLKELAMRNGLDLRHASFRGDMDKLIVGLKGSLSGLAGQRGELRHRGATTQSFYDKPSEGMISTDSNAPSWIPLRYLVVAFFIGLGAIPIVQPTSLGGDIVLFLATFAICVTTVIILKVTHFLVAKLLSKPQSNS